MGKGIKRSLRILAIAGVLLLLLLPAIPVHADNVAQPTSVTLTNIFVNQNLIYPGDMLVYFTYDFVYATIPTITADNAFLFRLLNGTTELGRSLPYPFNTGQSTQPNGYNKGISAIYLTPAENPGWGGAYTLCVYGNIINLPSFSPWQQVLTNANYSTKVTQTDNQVELAAHMIVMMHELDIAWGTSLYYGTNLLTIAGNTTVLATAGQSYLNNAIPNAKLMMPGIYTSSTQPVDYTALQTWSTNQSDAYAGRYTYIAFTVISPGTYSGVTDDTKSCDQDITTFALFTIPAGGSTYVDYVQTPGTHTPMVEYFTTFADSPNITAQVWVTYNSNTYEIYNGLLSIKHWQQISIGAATPQLVTDLKLQFTNPEAVTETVGVAEVDGGGSAWVTNLTAGLGGLLGGSSQLGSGLAVCAVALACIIWASFKYQSVLSGFIGAILVATCGFIIGWLPGAYFGILAFLCAFYTGVVLFLNRA